MSDTASEVRAVLAQALAVDEQTLTLRTQLADLPADSLTLMEAVSALEEHLGVELPDSNAFVQSLREVGDIVDAVETARRGGQPGS